LDATTPKASHFAVSTRWTVDKWYGTGKPVAWREVLTGVDDARISSIR
jgi:hypothetical protein